MTNKQFVKVTQIPSYVQGLTLNKINFWRKLGFYPIYMCKNNAPLAPTQIFRTDANSKQWSSFTLSLEVCTPQITRLSRRISSYCDQFNAKKEVHIRTTHNQLSQNVLQPTIWPPAAKYLPLTSHLSDFYSGWSSVSAGYHYRELTFHSKKFPLG